MHKPTSVSHIPADAYVLTVHEVASALRIDSTTVRRWIKQGVLEAVSLPHPNKRQSYRIKRSTLNKILTTTFDPDKD